MTDTLTDEIRRKLKIHCQTCEQRHNCDVFGTYYCHPELIEWFEQRMEHEIDLTTVYLYAYREGQDSMKKGE